MITYLLECDPPVANQFATRLIALGVKNMPPTIDLNDIGIKIVLNKKMIGVNFDEVLEVFHEMIAVGASLTQEIE